MPNPFDQFDEGGNAFDQFDAPAVPRAGERLRIGDPLYTEDTIAQAGPMDPLRVPDYRQVLGREAGRDVPLGEAILRGIATGGERFNQLGNFLGLGLGGAVEAIPGAQRALGALFGDPNAITNTAGRGLDAATRQIDEVLAPQEYERVRLPARVGYGVGATVNDLATAIATGGESIPAQAAVRSTLGRAIQQELENTALTATRASIVPGATRGAELAQDVIDAGGTPLEAGIAGGTGAAATALTNVIPASASGNALVRAFQGAVSNPAADYAQAALEDLALPEQLRSGPMTAEDAIVSALSGSALATGIGERGPERLNDPRAMRRVETNPFDAFDTTDTPTPATITPAPEDVAAPAPPSVAPELVPSPPAAGEVQSPATPLSPAAKPATADDVTPQAPVPEVGEPPVVGAEAVPPQMAEPAPATQPEVAEPITQPNPEPQITSAEIVERSTPGGVRFAELASVRRAVDAAEQSGRAGDLMRSIEAVPTLSDDQRWLAGKLAPVMDSLDVRMVRPEGSEDAGGYNNIDNTLHVQQAVPSVALHEALHGATSALLTNPVVRNNPTVRQVRGEFETMLSELQGHVRDGTVEIPAQIARTIANAQGPLSNIKELLTYGMTEKPFQDYLRALPAPAGIQARNMWEAFKQAIHRLLGAATPQQRTFLDQLIESSGALVDFAAANPEVARAAQRGEAARIVEQQTRVARDTGEAPSVPAEPPRGPQAPPQAQEPAPQRATSTKNRVVEEEREAAGRNPVLREARKSNERTLAEAQDAIRDNPNLPAEVIRKLTTEGTATVSPTEEAVLLVEKVRLMNERDAAAARASDTGLSADQRAIAQQRWDAAEAAINDIDQATTASGRQWGRLGQFRQRLLREDFTLAALERKERAARGRPLTQAESDQVRRMADEIESLQKRLDEAQKRVRTEVSREGVRAAVTNLQERAKRPSGQARTPKIQALRKRADAARQTLKALARDAAQIVGIDPAELGGAIDPAVRQAAVDIGALHVADGVESFDKFREAMRKELGGRYADIAPDIAGVYADAQALNAEMDKPPTPARVVEDIDGEQPTHRDVGDVALAVIRGGVRGEQEIVDATTKALTDRFPDFDEDQTRQLLGETGRAAAPTRDEDRNALRELKTLVRLQQQIDDLEEGLPRKTGAARQKATKAVQQKRAELNALLREADARSGGNEARQQVLRDMRVRNLRKAIAELERQIETGERPGKKGKRKADPEEMALVERKAALQKELRRLDASAKLRPDPEAVYQRRRASDIAREIERIEARMQAGDYAPRQRVQRMLNAENERAAFELDKAKAKFRERQFQIHLAQRSKAAKFLDNTASGLNLARAIMTGLDLSAIGRQGAIQLLSHPLRTLRTVPTMLRAAFSPTQAHATMEKLRARPNWPEYQKAGVFFAEEGGPLSKLEEAYMSRWLQHNDLKPGEPVRNVGRRVKNVALAPFRASGRAYSTALNVIRADAYDALKATLSRDGESLTPAEQKALGNFVNVTTGRGKIGVNDDAGTVINTLFFAPRLVSSRFQYLLGAPFLGGNARSRKLIAQEYARFAAGAAIVYGMGALASAALGDDSEEDDDRPFVESDPRSSTFGRFRFGDTYLEPLGGLTQVATLLSRVLSGETKTNAGEIQPLRPGNRLTNGMYEVGNLLESHGYDRLGNLLPQEPNYEDVPYGGTELGGTIGDYLRYKLSPIAGATLNTVTSTNAVGQPTTALKEAGSLVTPMIFGNAADVIREQGAVAGSAITAAEVFGAGVQRRDRSSFAAPDYSTLSFDQRQVINDYERESSKVKQSVEQLRKLAKSFPRDSFAGDVDAAIADRAAQLGMDGVSVARYAAGGKKAGLKRNPSGSVQMEFADGTPAQAVIESDKAIGRINKAIQSLQSLPLTGDELSDLVDAYGIDVPTGSGEVDNEVKLDVMKKLAGEREALMRDFLELSK